ncbi:MAG TPA: PAS domain-containing sensor histidine kinase [Thermoanaerobaculia bacterium]|nr:PAS domain-containing sensor histidine kinase [Thermoanaerobaculia bacterium]
MSNAPCGFVAFADDGTIVELNQTLAEMLDYTRVELLGWHMDKILPPGGRIFHHTYLFPMLKVQERVDEVYLALRTKHGADIPVLLNGVRRERDGRFVSDCVCLRMLQRHEYEEQLLQARRLAEQSSDAKAKFLSMMSHDLRAPLTAIYGNAQLLATSELTGEQRESVESIQEACRMQMTLINDILEYARLDTGRVEVRLRDVPVSDAVARAEALIRLQAAEAGLSLEIDECEAGFAVIADPHRLQQILLNLLTNAVKYTPAGGTIAVSCEGDPERVRIRVRDTGIGIAAEDLQRIFSPFVQIVAGSAAAARGVGLGLAISRDLARAMHGEVTAESVPGAGSTFTIELPAGTVLDAVGASAL